MGEQMTFPDTWEEFEKFYGFTDKEQIYTNGSRLIPSFRVEQWLDHLPSAQPEDYTEMKREFIRIAEYIDMFLECSDEQKETLIGFISRLAEFMPWTERRGRMTKEEAIELLLESKDNSIERTMREWEEWDKRYLEAIDVAIEALSAERKGKWVLIDGYRCSRCNYKLQTTGIPMCCPNCKAHMRG